MSMILARDIDVTQASRYRCLSKSMIEKNGAQVKIGDLMIY